MRRLIGAIIALALILPTSVVLASPATDALADEIASLEARVSALEALHASPSPTPPPSPTPTPEPSPTPTPEPTPSPTPSPSPTPEPTPTPAPGPWTLVFDDQFTTLDKTRYGAYPCCWGDTRYKQGDTVNGGLYTGTDRMFHDATNGVLEVGLYRDANNQPRSVSFSPRNAPGGSTIYQLYGRYEIKFRATQSTGWKTAWLLWPQSENWPPDGEIDFPEGDLDGTISAFMHRQDATSGSDQDAYSTSVTYADWHTAVIEWAPNDLKFYLDGQLIGHSTSRVPNTPMRWQVQTETSLNSHIPTSSATVFIDYMKVWSYTP